MHSTLAISQKTREIIIASGLFRGNAFLIRLCADAWRLHTLRCWLCTIIRLKVWQEPGHHPPYPSQPLPTWHLPTIISFTKCHVMSFWRTTEANSWLLKLRSDAGPPAMQQWHNINESKNVSRFNSDWSGSDEAPSGGIAHSRRGAHLHLELLCN